MVKRKVILFIFLLVLITQFLGADDIFIAAIVITRSDQEDISIKEATNLSSLFQKELISLSSDKISYKALPSLKNARERGLNVDKVTSSLDALAICFYQNIDFLIYGTMVIDSEKNQYTTSIKLYSKEGHRIIYEKNYAKIITTKEAYIVEMVNIINPEVIEIFDKIEKGEVVLGREIELSSEEDRTGKEAEGEAIGIEETAAGEQEKEEDIDNKKIFGFFISIGYYFPLSGEWVNIIIPQTSVESGLKMSLVLTDSDNFDLLLRPGMYFNYSFALNKPGALYVHFHSLTGKIGLELYFEFSDFFAFSVGGGPEYKVNIIDFQSASQIFRTDIPYAFGIFTNIGIEFTFGKDKSFGMGITNILDFTFFSETNIDFKILLHFLFKV